MNKYIQIILCTFILTYHSFRYDKQWEDHKSKYGLSFPDIQKENKRWLIFEQNMNYINRMNARNLSFKLAPNKFAHLERINILSLKDITVYTDKDENPTDKNSTTEELVDLGIDWRKHGAVTTVKDQGECGSGWAFCTIGSLEGVYAISFKNLTDMSVQQLVDCSHKSNSCSGGRVYYAYKYLAGKGIVSEKDYPYVEQKNECMDKDFKEIIKVKKAVRLEKNEKALKNAIKNIGPITVAVDGSSDAFHFYKKGIFYNPDCSKTKVNHGMTVVGYSPSFSKKYYILVSYGTDWGEDGYIRMAMDKDNNCGIASFAMYPLI